MAVSECGKLFCQAAERMETAMPNENAKERMKIDECRRNVCSTGIWPGQGNNINSRQLGQVEIYGPLIYFPS